MTICPIAIVAGCRKCPAFSVCPLKTVIGDAAKPGKHAPDRSPAKSGEPPGSGSRRKK